MEAQVEPQENTPSDPVVVVVDTPDGVLHLEAYLNEEPL
jgi:hypothetical protein